VRRPRRSAVFLASASQARVPPVIARGGISFHQLRPSSEQVCEYCRLATYRQGSSAVALKPIFRASASRDVHYNPARGISRDPGHGRRCTLTKCTVTLKMVLRPGRATSSAQERPSHLGAPAIKQMCRRTHRPGHDLFIICAKDI